ncbi:hypothetical protein HNP84_009735 [Thermocatellispora tengchongensis]|uniref:Uncharacterized protein n=1 Tax=Thermocatellispora tengchongensis TaxID=1073253 RepID=A0A840PQD9_9ACTN|nr:hypothetical protein [Thermocatellispora tengchongensis]MBB5139970.1 hypothetical protein [Thermocatellispora tengchongensis]
MATILEDFEDATLNLTITGTWARASGTAAAGTWALKAATIGAEEATDAIVTVPPQATSLSFYYRVSSEADYDLFHVLVDGTEVLVDSGDVPWTQTTIDVTGASQVTFRYDKDGSVNELSDTAWIDQLSFTVPDTGTPKNSTDGGTLVETTGVVQVPEIAKASSDTGHLGETRWVGEPQTVPTPPSIRSTSTATSGAAAYTINTPAGVVANDVLIGLQAADRGSTANMTTPTGGSAWELLDSLDATTGEGVIQAIRVWWKRASSSEPGSYTFNQRNGSDGVCLIAAVKDASLSATPLIARSTQGTNQNVTTPGITPSSGNDLELRLVAAYPQNAAFTLTPPAGLTALTSIQSRTYTAAAAAARMLQSNTVTDPADFVASVSSLLWRVGVTVAVAPAVTGPPQVTQTASDSGAVVESPTVTVQPDGVPTSANDVGALTETAAATADLASSDVAELGEAAAIDAAPGSSDQAAVTEASMLMVGWGGADQAALTEVAQVDVDVTAADTGTLAESVAIAETVGPVAGDHATLTEAIAVEVQAVVADVGALTESADVAVLKDASDSAQLVESATVGLSVSDSATLVEFTQAEVSVTAADSVVLTDQAVVEAPRFATDSAVLVETATVATLGRDVSGLGPMYRRWSAGSPYRRHSAGEPHRAWGAGSPRT